MKTLRVVVVVMCSLAGSAFAAGGPCESGALALSDARDIAGVRGTIERRCPCASFDGTTAPKRRGAYRRCVGDVLREAVNGPPLLGVFTLRRECKATVSRIHAVSTCGRAATEDQHVCCEATAGNPRGVIRQASRCVSTPSTTRTVCDASPFAADICAGGPTNGCKTLVVQTTVDIPSAAAPAHTPGSPSVVVTNPKLLAQFGAGADLNQARYTRYHLAGAPVQPDAIIVMVPGFEGGAGDFRILGENLITRAKAAGQILELWAFDRRTNQLEDLEGLDIAEEFFSPDIALDWLFGGELGLGLDPVLVVGPGRRAEFYDAQADTAFIANWTNLTFSQDIDAVVTAARAAARNQNVFLGGHSAGTGFAARYASTDFNLTGVGAPDPGYAKLRGIVLLEGGGGATGGAPFAADSLDRMEAKFDGGLFGAVRDNAARCVDGTTACTIATEATDCVGQVPPKCTLPTTAYSTSSILNPRILASVEPPALQGVLDPDGGENILSVDQGAPGNSAIMRVPDLSALQILPKATVEGGIGSFIDDDGPIAAIAFFVATSVGAPGPTVGGLLTWQDITEGPMPASVIPNNGPAPTTIPVTSSWGQEVEVTRFDRLLKNFYQGRTNFTDWYYPNAGPSVTSITGVCSSGTCTVGNVGASCSQSAQCSQAINLDSTALSIGRGRRDIENLTQAGNINVPVLCFGASNGLARSPATYVPFGQSIATCTAPSCDGSTPRVVNASSPNPAFPTLGDVAGGFEAYMAIGFAHVDVLTAEDDANNPVVGKLAAFIARNVQ
jgi:pimeloyl-ACP methyl ester carboxylesterase